VGASVVAGRYRLESPLGQSAMAEVWLAHDLELERPVALKLLTPEADRTRFEREARAAASLSHPNVTRLYDYGQDGDRLYMALEYLPGGTLEDRLANGRRLRDDETVAIAAQLAAGLEHAHAHGLVHRDVKPANVLFDDEDRPKLADFGIARLAGAHVITEAGTIIGTATYISPEQAAGEPATPASDVYSFGVLLYRMLTGRLPFESESPVELARMHREVAPPALVIVRPDAPPDLAQLATEALEKDPRRRPPDGAALAARLGAPVTGAETASAAETAVMPRPGRRRRRVAPVPLLVAAVVLLGAAGVAAGILVTHGGSGASPATTPASTRAQTTSTPAVVSQETTASEPTSTRTQTRPATSPPTTTGVTEPTTSTAPTTTTPSTTAAVTTTAVTTSGG
jgi:serine/threonine protein kinase